MFNDIYGDALTRADDVHATLSFLTSHIGLGCMVTECYMTSAIKKYIRCQGTCDAVDLLALGHNQPSSFTKCFILAIVELETEARRIGTTGSQAEFMETCRWLEGCHPDFFEDWRTLTQLLQEWQSAHAHAKTMDELIGDVFRKRRGPPPNGTV